mmetsp:Transcript_3912/g.7905  ORF Transcript_3912/g.7905 Transcript_3912/m.7905 type:complete len:315 (-) Transcript_3912:117-1061(-)
MLSCTCSLLTVVSFPLILSGIAQEQCQHPSVEVKTSCLVQRATRRDRLLNTGPNIGVVVGYDNPSMIAPGSAGAISLQLTKHWASLHNYSLFVEPNLGRLGSGPKMPVWDKIAAVRHYLTKVDALFWLDLDVFIVDPSRRAAELLRRDRSSCTRTGQPEDDAVLAQDTNDIFLWAATAEFAHFDSGTDEHTEPTYRLGLCAGAFALWNHPRSFKFMDDVWNRKHSQGWPAEQGAMWDVLLNDPDLLSKTCVLAEDTFVYESLESPERALQKSGPFAIHATGFKGALAEQKRNAISRAACDHVFSAMGGCPEPHM